MKSFLWYTALRVALLVAVGGLAYAIGMRGLLLIAAAFLGSGVLSYFALDRSRNAFGASVGGFFRRLNDRIDSASRAEDPDDGQLPASGAASDSVDSGVGVEPAEEQVHAEVVEPEHAQADDR